MPNRCVVGGCLNTYQNKVKIHKFPKSPILKQCWVKFVQCTRADFEQPSKNSVICGKHFKPDCYWKKFGSSTELLLESAIPTEKSKKAAPATQKRKWTVAFTKQSRKKTKLLDEVLGCSPTSNAAIDESPNENVSEETLSVPEKDDKCIQTETAQHNQKTQTSLRRGKHRKCKKTFIDTPILSCLPPLTSNYLQPDKDVSNAAHALLQIKFFT
uniref:THAP-type domain-containing protein n=2 Tax=Ciona intestinalis TaxID=7719 RepID=F7BH60_CIOIN